jgi:DNA-binding transcriptional ArsR family regulator
MIDNTLEELHEYLKEPLRRKILLKLGAHKAMDLDELTKQLKDYDKREVLFQLDVLGDLILKTEDHYAVTDQGVLRKTGGKYTLTEKGYSVVRQMIAYPEIIGEDYREKVHEKFRSKQAHERRRITYVLLGATMGFSACFLGSVLFSSISKMVFHGPMFFFDEGLPFFLTVFVFAPAIGSLIGYLFGAGRNFKRPEPEWAQ